MISFVHTADVHFGMENYGKIDPKTGIHTRLLDFERAFNACIDYSIDHDVDFLVFCGDAYKTTHPSPTQQRLLLKCLLRLYQARIPVVIVVGNHDHPLSFGKANTLDMFKELPLEGFHVVSKASSFVLETKSGPVQVVGIPWPTRNTITLQGAHLLKTAADITKHISEAVSKIIAAFAQELNPTVPAILASHLTVSNGIFSGSEKRAVYGNDPILLPSQLAIKPFDYVALGHLHRYQQLNPNGHPPVVYSGSIERIDFGERKEDKGFCHVTIHNKEKTTYSFIPTPMRPFIQIEVALTADEKHTEHIIEEIKKYDITDAVVKIVYRVPTNVKSTVDIKAVQDACRSCLHLVGIIPVYKPATRQQRSHLSANSTFLSLLDSYLDTKPELIKNKERLMQRAQELYEQTESNTEE